MRKIIENGIHYKIKEDKAIFESCEELEGEVCVPETVEGVPVVEAEAYAFSRKRITELQLPKYLAKIGRYAFYRSFALKKLCFSDALVDLGAGSFTGCSPKEIEIDFYHGEKSCLKFIADEVRFAFHVTMRFHKEDGSVEKAVVLFPEHYEEDVENTPARILEIDYHGAGGYYRQCFYNKELNFQDYDSYLIWAITEDEEETVADIAANRLKYPYKLTETAKDQYEAYLKEHMACAGKYFVNKEDSGMLKFFCEEKYFTKETMDVAIEAAAQEKKTEILSMLMDEKRKLFPKQKKTFEF